MSIKTAVALALLTALGAGSPAAAQQRNAARVPNFMVVSFRSPEEPKLGVEIAEAIRQRMLRFFPMPPLRTLRIVSREDINNSLTISGFGADTVVSTTDLGILSKQLGVEETMEGSVRRTAQGVEARARFYFNGNVAAPEVLPAVTEKNAEAAGRKVAELYVQARKELPAYERCKNALIQKEPDQAIVAAREAIAIYPQGVLSRACLLTAYSAQYKNFPADSLIGLGETIKAIDPENVIAISQLADAYRTKNDTAHAVENLVALSRLSPSIELVGPFIDVGAPEKALVIVREQLQQNPGDVPALDTQWKLLQRLNRWKEAIAAGEEMVKYDTARADTGYFRRQIGAAIQDSQPQLVLQYMAKATTKFPRDVRLLQAYVGELRRQGQLALALDVGRRVMSVDPKAPLAAATVITLYTQTGKADSAVAFAKQALVGADSAIKDEIGQGLLALIRPAMDTAQKDTAATADVRKAHWADVLKRSAAVDSIVPTSHSAYYMSVSAFYVAQFGVANFTEVARTNRPAACAMLKEASDNLLIVDLNMSRGGRVDPTTARALLTATSDMKPGLAQARTQLGCR